jgi:hypothetical protein
MKVVFYKFYTLDDFVQAMELIPKDLQRKIDAIPNLQAEYLPMIDEEGYYISVTLINEAEDN